MRIGNSFSLGLETALAGEVEGSQTKYMDEVDNDFDIKEDDVSEGEVLAGDIAKTDEFLVGLECLIATMEAAALDQNFGKYNLPLYHNEAKRLMSSLRLSTFGLSTENYDSPYVLSTEGFKETASKVWRAFQDMVKRFFEWLGKRFGKGSKSEQITEKAEELKEKSEALAKKPEVVERIKKREFVEVHFTLSSLLSGRVKDEPSLETFAKEAFDLFREVDQNFEKLKAFLKDLYKAKTEDEVNGIVAGHALSKLLVSQEHKNHNIVITMPADPTFVYKTTLTNIESTGSVFRATAMTARGVQQTLQQLSSELMLAVAKADDDADKAIYDAKNTDEIEGHLSDKKVYTAKRKAISEAIGLLSRLVTENERVASDLIRLNMAFDAALNVASQTSAA
jgi:hypothetical protein